MLTDKTVCLRKWHRTIVDKVTALFAMDLIRQKEAWKRAVKELRLIFQNLETEFRKDLQGAWRTLGPPAVQGTEYQYHRGLETLNDMLPQMSVSSIFKQRKLQFDPPLEEIRTSHYKQVKDFLQLPLVFKGLVEASEAWFLPRHDRFFRRRRPDVYQSLRKTEALFVKLADEQKKRNTRIG